MARPDDPAARRKPGHPPFDSAPASGSIGGQVGGHIDLRLRYDSENQFQVALLCLRKWRQRRSSGAPGSAMNIELIWHAQGLAHVASSPSGTRLSFRFDVPEDLIPSELESIDYHEWQVALTARLPGPDLDRKYKIPVFPTGQASQDIPYDSTEHSGYEKFNRAEAQSILKLSRDRDGSVVLKYPIFSRRKARAGLMLLAVGLGAGLPGIAMLMDEAEIVGIGFFFVGLLFMLGGFYILFHNISVKIDSMRLKATRTLLGIPIHTREAAKHEIDFLGLYQVDWIAAWIKEGKAITISQ